MLISWDVDYGLLHEALSPGNTMLGHQSCRVLHHRDEFVGQWPGSPHRIIRPFNGEALSC